MSHDFTVLDGPATDLRVPEWDSGCRVWCVLKASFKSSCKGFMRVPEGVQDLGLLGPCMKGASGLWFRV